ncbi:hypothetical protein Hdeb2414_s0023g00643651 [Helianthus debilis subsp. tardiflorus]
MKLPIIPPFFSHFQSSFILIFSTKLISLSTMSRKGRASIRSIITQEELESFVTSYHIPLELSPSLPWFG